MNMNKEFHMAGFIAAILTLLAAAAAPVRAEGTGMFGATKLDTTAGVEIYRQICQGCHMSEGQGAAGAGKYPALARDKALASRQYMALTILEGRRNMPAFAKKDAVGFFFTAPSLTDEQVAAVINYVRTHFGNHYKDPITASEVKALHHSH
jgi:mono/diheme cytochrome c family protein